jgi:hypothetical protein
MKHAGVAALDQLEPLLKRLRALDGMTERGRGVFYSRSKAFLRFHEDPAGLFADLRDPAGADFDRFKVDGPERQDALVEAVSARLSAR